MACGALALPATGWASPGGGVGFGSGGSGIGSGNGSSTGTQETPAVQSGNVSVSVSGNGVTLQTDASAMLRRNATFSGTAPSRFAGDTVVIQRSGHETHWRWVSTVSAPIQSDGSFAAVWHANHIGRFSIRALIARGTMAQSANATPSLIVTVYRPSLATQYGPGFYGHRTACGVRLRRSTIGVANRTLPCGTDVAVYFRGRTMTVPVIDRGPYANHADWDLTTATGRALGIRGSAKIGAVSLPVR